MIRYAIVYIMISGAVASVHRKTTYRLVDFVHGIKILQYLV